MPSSTAAESYLTLDEKSYRALIERLVAEVKAKSPDYPDVNAPALRAYFEVAVTKGVSFSQMNLDALADLQPDALQDAANDLPDKLSETSRESFVEAAEKRTHAMRWDKLFPNGSNEITLSLFATAQSVDDRIAAYIQEHNQRADAAYAQAQVDDPKNAGKAIEQQEIRRDPADPSKLQTINPNKPRNEDGSKRWQPGQRLGAFFEAHNEWALLDDFQLENSRKNGATNGKNGAVADIRELMNRTGHSSADKYDPDSLRIVISRDPQKVGEMSSAQHWQSCMTEGGINFRFVPNDIEAGSLVAYLVSKDDPQARYPLMRQLLKPYHNQQTGETILVPAKVYGADAGGNARTRNALHDSLSQFVRENVNSGKAGEYAMDSRLYGDGQPGYVNLQAIWSDEAVQRGLQKYYDSALQEHMAEWAERESKLNELKKNSAQHSSPIDMPVDAMGEGHEASVPEYMKREIAELEGEIKKIKSRIRNLTDPVEFAKGFYRETRKTSPDSLPGTDMVLRAANSPEVTTRNLAIHQAVLEGNTEPLRHYLDARPLTERITLMDGLLQIQEIPGQGHGAAKVSLWREYIGKLDTAEARVIAALPKYMGYENKYARNTAAEILWANAIDLESPKERAGLVSALTEILPADSLWNGLDIRLVQKMADDLENLSNAGERIHSAKLALRITEHLSASPETLQTLKATILNKAYVDIEVLPTATERIALANEILSAHTQGKIDDKAVPHAKRIIVESLPLISGDEGQSKPSALSIIESIPIHDTQFKAEIAKAMHQEQQVSQIGDELAAAMRLESTADVETIKMSAIREWAQQVNALPQAEWRMAAVMGAQHFAMKEVGHEGLQEAEAWKAAAGEILMDTAPLLASKRNQLHAYVAAYHLIPDLAVGVAIEEKALAIMSDTALPLNMQERLNLLQSLTLPRVINEVVAFDNCQTFVPVGRMSRSRPSVSYSL